MYSKDGYKRNSKDRNNPFNIIPSGNITMEDVDFPVFAMDDLGNSEIMMPGANYIFPGNEVFEIPLAQNGNEISLELLLRQAMAESSLDPNAVSDAGAQGLTQIMENALIDYQDATGDMNIDLFNPEDAKKVQTWYMNNLYNADFINKPNQSDTVRMAKTLASYNWGRGNLYNLLTEQKNKGVDIYSDDMDWIQYLPSETNEYLNKILFDTNEDFKSDTEKYYSDEKYAPYIDLYKEQGGDLPQAQVGVAIRKALQALKNVKKGLPAPEFPLYRDRPVISGKNYGTPGNPFVYHRTDRLEKLDWEFLKQGTTPGYLEKLGVKGTNTPGRYKGIWGFNTNYPIHLNPVGGYEPWLGSKTLDAWGNPAGYGHRVLQYQFRPNAKILDLSDRGTSAIIKNAKHHQALLDEGYDAILGKGETILLNANSVDNVYEMRNFYDQEMLKNFPEKFPVYKYGEELPKAQSGLFKIPKAIAKYFGKKVDDIPVSGSVLNKVDLDKTFSGNTTSTISKFSDEIENPNKLSIDNIEGDLIRRDKGKYLTFDESGNLISSARSTHFTGTGAPVETHFMGNWDDAVTTINLPLKDAIKFNPGQIRTSAIGDTYFYDKFNYPKSANIFTGDYQLFNQLKKSGYNAELSKESMDLFRQMNTLKPKILNKTATAAEKELFEKLAKQNADIHNQFLKSSNLKAVNPKDPNIPLGWEKFNPYKTEQRSIRSDALSPYVHFEQFPDYNIQALGRKFEKGMFDKMYPDHIIQPSPYRVKNIPTSSDLKIFQKEVLEGWTDDYAKGWLETYSKEGYDAPFGDLMKNIVEEKLNKNLPYLQYYDGGSLPEAQMGTFLRQLFSKGSKGLKKYFSKTKEGDIILDKNLQLIHGSKNPNLTLEDIELIEVYKALQSRQNSAKRLLRRKRKDGTYVPGDELAGFYSSPFDRAVYPNAPQSIISLNPKFTEGVSFQPVSFNSNIGYKFDLAKGSRIKDMSDLGTSSMTVRNLKRYLDEGYDGILGKDVTNSYEVLPLNKSKIINWEKVNPFNIFNPNKFNLDKFQDAGEYDEDGYKTVTYGANKKKYQDTGTWSEYEPYETYGGKTWRKRTYELSRDDLRYLEHKKSFLTDVNYRSGTNNPPKNLSQFIRNSSKNWRVQEIIKDNGATQYVLQYPTATGSFRTFALGDADSGLANLNPEYVQELKKTGKTGISGFSSWFDMTPQERKDYGYGEWFDKGFTRDLKVDQDGNTKSGWEHYGSSTPLSYRLSNVEIRRLPSSIVQKYNLVGNDKMTLDPNTGEIDFLTSTGGLRFAVSQKDMKWFQNPGRLKELATDSRFNYKEDNVLDYLNNPDFRYFADSEKVTLDPVKLDGVPTENDMSLQKPKPYESTVTLEPKTLDQIETEREDEIIKKRKYQAPISLDPLEFKGSSDKEQEIIKSNPYESVITLDEKEIKEIPVDDGSLIERRIQETPITLDPINVFGIDSDGTATTDGSKQRFVPKSDIEADMPEIVLTPGMEEERDKAKTIEDIMGNFQDVKGTTKYVNKSVKAILDAANTDDYTEKDLTRDLDIFKKYYGEENLNYLQDILDKTQGPKANRGIEVLEDGKFNVKMDRLNSIIDKYYAGEQLSAAENEEIKLYDLRSNDKIDIQPEENNKTDLLVDNKSYNLADQIYIYNQYLDDAFTSDNEEKSGNKIVDKINRVYYNQAKQKDMHVYDLLLAMQNEMRQ